MNRKLFNTLSSLCLLVTFQLNAAWLEVTGSAVLLESENTARTNALEDAVYQAMGYAGADLGSFPNLRPYLSSERAEYQFSGNEVRHVMVIQTRKKSGKFYLTARIDVYPSANSCHKIQYKKGVLLAGFKIISPQHAAMGGIYQLGDDFSTMLKRQIERKSQSFVVSGTTRVPVNAGQPSAMMMLAEDNDAQYIINGQITDLTSTLDQKLLKSDQVNRQFAVTIEIMDGKTGEVLMQNNYREIAEWPFSRVSQVDTKSARFWQSSYGQAIQRVSRNMMLDLESSLSCRTSLPEIVNVYGNKVQINIGRIHGVKRGDQLKLWHSAGFIDQQGIPRNRMVQTDITLTVDRVYEKSTELSVEQADLASSIQPGDLLTKQLPR
ncbi:flagellar assembly protein FlgT [Photobacterium chitinilyticum]|uniref:Flagellar basal-body protein n=1 Tax=Photobacterium chitinilyticum TaxID=2485123 RepID=A0A444JTS3_9GAMM|nr:flagellar assembly protein FlgT [Photobacterium chitinilyticum]RWX56517.1 flagellar basal-body protein [Photobacterium chitinilyticum]